MNRGLSLVVATTGEKDIRPFLNSLEAQTDGAYECIIIDQSASRAIEPIKAQYRNIKYFHSSKKGNSFNRNIGIEHASYELIGFPDDDCIYRPDVVVNVLRLFAENTTAGGISGVWANSLNGEPIMSGRNAEFASAWNIWESITNLTLFLRTEIVRKVGGYTEQFGLGSGQFEGGEETDLVLKILSEGVEILYTDAIVVLHRQDKYVITNPTKQAGYENAWGALFKKWGSNRNLGTLVTLKMYYLFSRTLLISLYYFLHGRLTHAKAYWHLNTERITGWKKYARLQHMRR